MDEPSVLFLGLLSIVSLLLAYLSWKFIEIPFRSKSFINRKHIFLFGTIGTIFFISIGIYGHLTNGISNRFSEEIRNHIRPINFKWKLNVRWDICHLQDINLSKHNEVCLEKNKLLLALWGDSHASSLYPGLRNLQNKRNDFGIIQMTQAGCGPIFNLEILIYRKNCNLINSNNLEVLKKIQPQILILNAAWKHWDYPLNDSELDRKLDSTIKIIKNALPSTRLIIIGPAPRWKISPQYDSYYVSREKNLNEVPWRVEAEILITTEHVLKKITLQNEIDYISATDILCDQKGCLTRVNEDKLDFIQSDRWHLSKYGSEFLLTLIENKIFLQ